MECDMRIDLLRTASSRYRASGGPDHFNNCFIDISRTNFPIVKWWCAGFLWLLQDRTQDLGQDAKQLPPDFLPKRCGTDGHNFSANASESHVIITIQIRTKLFKSTRVAPTMSFTTSVSVWLTCLKTHGQYSRPDP